MDIKQIKQIVDLMKRSGLSEFEIEEKDFKLRISRSNGEVQTVYAGNSTPPFPVAQAVTPPPFPAETAAPQTPEVIDESKLIKSPMVGTFYTAPSPDSPPFVNSGDAVGEDSVVCIVEAMKVMNEIKAETNGTIAEILVSNGDSVEFGQPLFRLK